MHLRRYFVFFIIFSAFAVKNYAQFEPNPELEWFTIETPHFYVIYHKGTERTANTVAKIAEEIYGPITSLYNYKPSSKTSWIVNDESDYSNGATDYYGNRIEIASNALDFDLRGTHDWLRNVITHEFTHIVQIQSAMKFSTKMPAIYLQWLNYEEERRPDVLYGYPNVIVSYPVSGSDVPAWLAEGVAQYQRQQLGYDMWDAHRDMLLRMEVLGGKMMTWEEMGQFASITTLTAESIYNHGFALVRYISEKYGEDKLREISKYLGNVFSLNCEAAFKKAIGKSGADLYKEWKEYLKKDYTERIKNLKPNLVDGKEIADVGFANYFPEYSPDGKEISYLSNKTYDYGATSLFIHKEGKKNDELLIARVSGSYSWSPDGKKIIFARRNRLTIHAKSVYDLYEYDIKSKKEKQVTFNLRAHSPSYSNDGEQICFVTNKDGTQNLFTAKNPNGKKIKVITQLTSFKNGEQIYAPKWSPDGKYIVFGYSKPDGRSIKMIDVNSSEIESLFQDSTIDFRCPAYSKDGRYLYLSADYNGIYNIYRYDLTNELKVPPQGRKSRLEQVTNVLGGAFMPSVDSLGNLTYASFNSTGYKISLLKSASGIDSLVKSEDANYIQPDRLVEKYATETDSTSSIPKDRFNWTKLHNFNDDNPPKKPSTVYRNIATPLFLIPVIRYDNYTKNTSFLKEIKPGLYFYSQDVLGRMGIFGGASMNWSLERDLFLQFDYDNGVPFFKKFFLKKLGFVPHFTLSGYNVTRKSNAALIAGIDTIPVDITYDLLEFDFDMAFKIINYNHNLKAGFSISRYSSKFDQFFFKSIGQQVPSSSTNYFNGRDLSLTYTYSNYSYSRNDDINPIGRHIRLRYDYEFNYLNPTFVVNDQGNLVEEFSSAKFHMLEADWSESFRLFNASAIGFRLRGGSILGHTQDNFFDFYASGFPGMKGYPFYAIGGNKYASLNLYYRFPVARNLNFNFLQFYFDKIFFSVFGDAGNAWNGNAMRFKDLKKDIGAEIRLQTYSYYVYPTSFALSAAYGLDKFSAYFPTTTNDKELVTYGKEWRFYFTMLFGFDFLTDAVKKF